MMNAGMVLNDRYEIVKVIGKGGMSTVYQARDLTNGNLLAIKDVERTGTKDNQVVEQSLVGEGRMLMQLSNPHLPRIYDIIESPERFQLVMDFIQGESLDVVIGREGAQPMDRVLDWGIQICEVFDYLHNQPTPIIYRDMKPANVILRPDGRLMMIDFGTARTQKLGVQMQADTICLGTAGFAAAEQFGGIGQSTARTDIFCLGATLYNMITGHSPSAPPKGILPLEQWNPELANTPLSYIIYKCTRNDPDERYQTARELRDELKRAQDGTFNVSGARKKHGAPSGNLKNAWQKQQVKSTGILSGGLSGLLGKSGLLNEQPKPEPQNVPQSVQQPANGGWQQAAPVHPDYYHTAPAQDPYGYPAAVAGPPQEPSMAQTWRKLMLAGAVCAVLFVVIALVMILIDMMTAGFVFLIATFGAAILAIVGAVLAKQADS